MDQEAKSGNFGCLEYRELFYDRDEDNLTAAELAALLAHESSCSSCHDEFSNWRRYQSALRNPSLQYLAPAGFTAGVMARLTTVSKPSRPLLWYRLRTNIWGKGIAAAAVIIALLSGSAGVASRYWYPAPQISKVAQKDQIEKPRATAPAIKPGTTTVTPKEVKPAASPTKLADSSGSYSQPTTPKPSQRVAATGIVPNSTHTYLSRSRVVTTTMLKLAVSDLGQAQVNTLGIIQASQAHLSSTVTARNNGKNSLIIRTTIAPSQSGTLITRLSGMGQVELSDTSHQNVTTTFTQTLQEYQSLKAQQSTAPASEQSRLENQSQFLEQQLDSWNRDSDQQVVIIWLEQ